jgi:hypothetical protein
LEAESSRILSPDDVKKAQSAAAAQRAAEISDIELAPTESEIGVGRGTSDIGLGKDSASGSGLTGLSALELDEDDDQVLGEGSDVTLSGESSGINIISPSDSGLRKSAKIFNSRRWAKKGPRMKSGTARRSSRWKSLLRRARRRH